MLEKDLRYIFGIIGSILPVVMLSLIPIIRADNLNPSVYSPDSKPYGLSFAQWSEKWWKWLISIPASKSPANDSIGQNCGVSQNNPNVWFLTGAGHAMSVQPINVLRICTIPAGKSILWEPAVDVCSTATFQMNVTSLPSCILVGTDYVISRDVNITIDGKNLENLNQYIVPSPIFNVTLPQANLFGGAPGQSQIGSVGYLIFLTPLSRGNHEIHFDQVVPENPPSIPFNLFFGDVTYRLKVQ